MVLDVCMHVICVWLEASGRCADVDPEVKWCRQTDSSDSRREQVSQQVREAVGLYVPLTQLVQSLDNLLIRYYFYFKML